MKSETCAAAPGWQNGDFYEKQGFYGVISDYRRYYWHTFFIGLIFFGVGNGFAWFSVYTDRSGAESAVASRREMEYTGDRDLSFTVGTAPGTTAVEIDEKELAAGG